MSYFASAALINTISNGLLGYFVYSKNKKGETNRAFFYYSIALMFWSGSYYFWQVSNNREMAIFWCKALMMGAIFIPILYTRFVYKLLGKKDNAILLFVSFIFATIFAILNLGDFLVKDVVPRAGFTFWPIAGPGYLPYLIIWIAVVVISVVLLIKGYRQSKGSKKTQLLYILLGTVIGYSGGMTNYPLWFNLQLKPWGNILITFYAIVIAYSILKYRLLNIKIIKIEAIVVAIFFGLLIDAIISENTIQFIIRIIFVGLFCIVGQKLIKNTTALEKAKTSLEHDKKQLVQLDKMKDEFLMMATHELTTPITAIRGKLSMAIDENMAGLNDQQKDYFRPAVDSINRLNKLSRDLLNVAKIDQNEFILNKEEVNLNDLVTDVVESHYQEATNKNNKLTFSINHDLDRVVIDEKKMKEALSSLIDNAIKFTENGEVKIATRLVQDTNMIEISVSDTGCGLDDNSKKHLFKKFGQAKRFDNENPQEQQGAGLGLYITKNIVKLHGGDIICESEPGHGATFTASIPYT